ncbi:MAG: hypothetical protein LUQ07_00435, partial [Methanospirillum sp.]|nr:hypothetical protein [Methanospirillum sp.]
MGSSSWFNGNTLDLPPALTRVISMEPAGSVATRHDQGGYALCTLFSSAMIPFILLDRTHFLNEVHDESEN